MVKVVLFALVTTILTLEYGITSPYHDKHRYTHRGTTRSSHHRRPKQHQHRIKKEDIMFPTGNIYPVSVPVDGSQWRCGRNATLIELKPDGKMGRREYEIVKTEIEKTNRDKVNFNITKVEKVKNSCLWHKYKYRQHEIVREAKENERMLFHGSSAARQMVHTGFDERYANYNGLFGPGLYFADLSSKSNGYSGQAADGTRSLLLCRVTLGKIYVVHNGEHWPHAPVGYHSVKGSLAQPEYIVYRGEQVYPEYLITYKT